VCGIAGALALDGNSPDARVVAAMGELLAHRGPDDAGLFADGPVVLAHRRLSILDLSAAGHQPMASSDGRFWLTYNGEIYNYVELGRELEARGRRLRTACDSEVLVEGFAEWGTALFDRLNGMFAFAVWDRRERRLTCVRDRFGVKPFYYAVAGGRFLFASEIKALFADTAVGCAANEPRLLEFLAHGAADQGAETLYRDVLQLEPGTVLELRPGSRPSPRRWYRLEPAARTSGDPAAAVREVLDDAVRLRLRSDVPVGTCLSGGVDSSSVVALAARARREAGVEPPQSFSARSLDPRLDEGRFIEAVAEATGTRSRFVFPTGDDAVATLDRVLWHMDEPFHGASVVGQWKVMELARDSGVTVLLDGQGGDEVFAGYHYMYPAYFLGLLAARPAAAAAELRARARLHGVGPATSLVDLAKHLLPAGVRGRSAPAWLAPDARPGATVAGRRLEEQQRFALTASPLPAYLHHEDRNSMAFSLEARVPFLDYRVVELGLSLRPHELLRDGRTKYALRRAMDGLVPADVLWRSDKQGFTVDQNGWLSQELRPLVAETLRDAERRPWFVADALRGAAQDAALWRAFIAERWLQLLVERRPAAPRHDALPALAAPAPLP
jgi:asparagine synthase (glutamine-hydrolysing)